MNIHRNNSSVKVRSKCPHESEKQHEYLSHVLDVLKPSKFSPGLPSSNLFSLEFTSTSSRDRMYPKLFIIYPLLDSVYSIFVSISTYCRNHQKVMLEFLRLERVLYRKHIVSVQTLITYKALILSGWQHLKHSPL